MGKSWLRCLLFTLLAACLGCAGVVPESASTGTGYAVAESAGNSYERESVTPGKFVALQAADTLSEIAKRRIIYQADVSIETSDLDAFSQQLDAELTNLGGFVANLNEQRYAGDRRVAKWTLRVDSSNFASFLTWLDTQANVVGKQVTSQDVTEEYVDLTARAENKRNTEQRLAKILDQRPGKLEEILSVEREIDRVREEIERIEGRLRYLSERAALSTITLTASTRVEYVAPKQATFETKISEAWNGSLGSLIHLSQNIVIGIVGMAPWLPIVLICCAAVFLLLRYAWRSSQVLSKAQHTAG